MVEENSVESEKYAEIGRQHLQAAEKENAKKLNNRLYDIEWGNAGDKENKRIGNGTADSDMRLGKTVIKVSEKTAIGDGFFIGSRGNIQEDVIIGTGFRAGNNIQVGKNAKIGNDVILGPNVIVDPNIKIGNNVEVEANTKVYRNIPDGVKVTQNGVYSTTVASDGKTTTNKLSDAELDKMILTSTKETRVTKSSPAEQTVVASSNLQGVVPNSGGPTKIMPIGKGHAGDDVKVIQTALAADGINVLPKGHVDSNFGSETRSALVAYQKKYKLKAQDGVFGEETLKSMIDQQIISPEDVKKFQTIPSLTKVAQSTGESTSPTSAPKQQTVTVGRNT
jgi:acetyltransferase-like isoleucine patch superfamily enzyme